MYGELDVLLLCFLKLMKGAVPQVAIIPGKILRRRVILLTLLLSLLVNFAM